jgi:hypothetical protein
MDWIMIGASPPTVTWPILTGTLLRLEMGESLVDIRVVAHIIDGKN